MEYLGYIAVNIAVKLHRLGYFLDELNVVQSFSAKGCPFGNVVVEAFFKFLKAEETNRKNYSVLSDLQLSLFEYIDGFYNNAKRPHSVIYFLSSADFESNFFSSL